MVVSGSIEKRDAENSLSWGEPPRRVKRPLTALFCHLFIRCAGTLQVSSRLASEAKAKIVTIKEL